MDGNVDENGRLRGKKHTTECGIFANTTDHQKDELNKSLYVYVTEEKSVRKKRNYIKAKNIFPIKEIKKKSFFNSIYHRRYGNEQIYEEGSTHAYVY